MNKRKAIKMTKQKLFIKKYFRRIVRLMTSLSKKKSFDLTKRTNLLELD